MASIEPAHEDKQKEDYGMFFSGLDLAQPAKTRHANIRMAGQDYQSPLEMILGGDFPVWPINRTTKGFHLSQKKKKN